MESREDILNVFHEVIQTGLDMLMLVKRVRVNTSVAPWMTQHLKLLILKRQKTFHKYGSESPQYKLIRNAVTCERKASKANFYNSKVELLKGENAKVCWKEVKQLGGMSSCPGNVISQIQAEGTEYLTMKELANVINQALLEPLEKYQFPQSLAKLSVNEESWIPEVTELRIQLLQVKLNPLRLVG